MFSIDAPALFIHFDCLGVKHSYYVAWWFSTVGQLAALLAFVALWYGTQLLRGDAIAARAKAASIAFAGVFLWYPTLCTRAFEMLRCTTVFPAVNGSNNGKRIERLSVDYSVDCDDALYSVHYVAALVLLAVATALPVVVIHRVRALTDDSDAPLDSISIGHRVAAELRVDPDNAQEAITHLLTGREFSFMTAGLGSQYLWWEAVDMLRKLSIVGAGTLLPTLVGATDPTMRVVLVMLVALGWLVVQVRLQPYKLQEVRRGVRPLGTRAIFPLPLQQYYSAPLLLTLDLGQYSQDRLRPRHHRGVYV